MHILISGDEVEYEPCCRTMEEMMHNQDIAFDPEDEDIFIPIDKRTGVSLNFCPHCGERVHIEHDISMEDRIRSVIREEMERMMEEQGFMEFGSAHNFGRKEN